MQLLSTIVALAFAASASSAAPAPGGTATATATAPVGVPSVALPANAVATPIPAGKITVNNVAFVSTSKDSKDLYFSAFKAFDWDAGYYLPNAGAALTANFSAAVPTKIGGSINWPNEMTSISSELFGVEGVLAAGGFLVPFKQNGGISFSPKTGPSSHGDWINLFTNNNGYFYHRALAYDVDADGQLDILSCRATKPIFGGAVAGALVYLTPKDRRYPLGEWQETILGDHCDTFFQVADLNGDGINEIITAEYWFSNFTVISTKNPRGSFTNPKDLVYNVIDSNVGHGFDLIFEDINGDGKKEILFTNHQSTEDAVTGSVYAYEVPSDINAPGSQWIKHILVDKLPVLIPGKNQASPGSPKAFQPKASKPGKPWIALAGDGSTQAYFLIPNSENPADWTYTNYVFHTCGNTVGSIAVGDVNGDGFADVFVPCHESNEVVAYTFK
ncbi:hypothetical protein HDU97_002709 [Phlyctochytrium planicorne]|nr:hypothetical protein HDU97_002709 [Phlyctochytrium planicorne]